MYLVYDNNNKITMNPISYNYLITSIFKHITFEWYDWDIISTLPLGECYSYLTYKIVRVI